MLNPVATIDSSLSKKGVRMVQNAEIQIGELSRQTGCNVETIRYYERVGLLPRPARTAARYRLYDPADVRRLVFVRRARELGFTLDEIRALLALSANNNGKDTCAAVRQVAAAHLADVRAKIADLRAMGRVLSDAVRRCDTGELPGCPLIETLSANVPLHLVGRTRAAKPSVAA
jgi:MerR family transcriptional regulator, mercuric resistance operon regulatory protein